MQSFFGKYTSTMERIWACRNPSPSFLKNREHYLVGGDWNHGILNDFPILIGKFIIPTDALHDFSEG
jgi:hypothetical protein